MLILASSSPRRQELLRNAGITFTVQPADVPEVLQSGEHPTRFAERLAREKASAIFGKFDVGEHAFAPPSADTGRCGAPAIGFQPGRTSLGRGRAPSPHDPPFVLGADTVVVVDEHVLGKPVDAEDAARMLRLLADRTHEVTTGVCLVGRDFVDVRSETTRVTFTAMTNDDIAAYVATGEPMDKAGAYGIQGVASRWIPRIEGDYFNVVGLPTALVWRMLREHGII
jgi:septum formation protein